MSMHTYGGNDENIWKTLWELERLNAAELRELEARKILPYSKRDAEHRLVIRWRAAKLAHEIVTAIAEGRMLDVRNMLRAYDRGMHGVTRPVADTTTGDTKPLDVAQPAPGAA